MGTNGEQAVDYLDGPPVVSLPSIVLCRSCASDVRKYIQHREAEEIPNAESSSPFGVSDADDILSQLVENPELILGLPKFGFGVRHIDGEWRHAYQPLPSPQIVETIERETVVERILNSSSLTLRQADESAWELYQSRGVGKE